VMSDLVAKEFDFISLRLQRLWRHCGVSAGYQRIGSSGDRVK
jgi:hypothetical protein